MKLLEKLPETPAREAQIDVLRNCHSEKKVFDLYVVKAPEKNETLFYAARDAAQFVMGKLELETLLGTEVPDAEDREEDKAKDEAETIVVSKAYLEGLEKRIERLEARFLGRKRRLQRARQRLQDKAVMIQAEAAEYIGCDKTTLMRWTNKGLVKAELRGRNICYTKDELDANPTIRQYMKKMS